MSLLVDSIGLPVEFLSPSRFAIFPPILLEKPPSSIQCLAVGVCISLSQLLEQEISQKLLPVPGVGSSSRAALSDLNGRGNTWPGRDLKWRKGETQGDPTERKMG